MADQMIMLTMASETAQKLFKWGETQGHNLQNMAGNVMNIIKHDTGVVGKKGREAINDGLNTMQQTIHQVGDNSLNDVGNGIRNTFDNVRGYASNTTFNQMGRDLQGAIVNSNPYQKAQQGAGWVQGKGSTLLSDLDKFYHTADGSYDRTKVGLTAAAGLGIAGIAGYNMNN